MADLKPYTVKDFKALKYIYQKDKYVTFFVAMACQLKMGDTFFLLILFIIQSKKKYRFDLLIRPTMSMMQFYTNKPKLHAVQHQYEKLNRLAQTNISRIAVSHGKQFKRNICKPCRAYENGKNRYSGSKIHSFDSRGTLFSRRCNQEGIEE